MLIHNRRDFLRVAAGTAGVVAGITLLPPAIRKALSIAANNKTGTIMDVEHIVVLMQENRSFDHYFGTMAGVRGFGDRFPVPVADTPTVIGKNIWYQINDSVPSDPKVVPPFRLNTIQSFDYMRVEGTPHGWLDAQAAWNNGRMDRWPRYKHNHAMGYFTQEDIPFQYAMANAFTLCDAYHCSFQGGTNTNRIFHWTGTNDPSGKGNGPATYNNYDSFDANPGKDGGYTWTTYPERLEKAGITWQVYENMKDNYTDNPLAGFHSFRKAWYEKPGYSKALKARGVTTRDLEKLKADVLADTLPQVSWIIATAEGSEHPSPSSPAQGADYTAKVLDALTANPDVWSKTVFIVNFDENDGFFDHVPPPSVPAYTSYHDDPKKARFAGASTVDTTGEYHDILLPYQKDPLEPSALHRAYGLGPRVPLYAISPWSKGGWVNSEVFDHTSVIRFIEKRFGVKEPNISPWRRAVCGDLTSVFNFKDPNNKQFLKNFPDTSALAERARALKEKSTPPTPTSITMPMQAIGTKPARPLPYALHTSANIVSKDVVSLTFNNTGSAAAVFHVYDRKNLDKIPRRYTVEPNKALHGRWECAKEDGSYDLWVLGPNGYHRHFSGTALHPFLEVKIDYDANKGHIKAMLINSSKIPLDYTIKANAYFNKKQWSGTIAPQHKLEHLWSLLESSHWYDFTVTINNEPTFLRRFAGHIEDGKASISDPAMSGTARSDQEYIISSAENHMYI